MTRGKGPDYEELWKGALLALALTRERTAARYSIISGLAFGVVAWVQLVLSTAPGDTLGDDEFIADVMQGFWLLLGLLALLWWTAFCEYRRARSERRDLQLQA